MKRTNLARLRDSLHREAARRFLDDHARDHLSRYPQMACFAFDLISIEIMIDGRYDNQLLQFVDRLIGQRLKGKTVLDVGANIGNHAVAFAASAKKVIAFEPHPRTVQLLRLNTMDFPTIEVVEKGASDCRASLAAVCPRGNHGASSITDRPPGEQEFGWTCHVDRLDDLYDPEWGDIGLIKIDVEGHEAPALRGMAKIINANNPIVLFEQNSGVVMDGTTEAVEFLRSSGYAYFYEIGGDIKWRTPQALPGLLRKPLRFAEGAIFGPPDNRIKMVEVNRLESRSYNALLASTVPLEKHP